MASDDDDNKNVKAAARKTARGRGKGKADNSAGSSNEDVTLFSEPIEKSKRITVSKWKGRLMIHIREYYNKDGVDLPGKKGISISHEGWNALKNKIAEIDAAIERGEHGSKPKEEEQAEEEEEA